MRAARPEVAPLGRRVGELIIPRGGGARATQFSAGRAGGEENAEARAIQRLLWFDPQRHAFIGTARGVTATKAEARNAELLDAFKTLGQERECWGRHERKA